MVYNARDLLTDIAADAWNQMSRPTKLIAVIRPLVEVARILDDHGMLEQFRLLAVLNGIEEHVPSRGRGDLQPLATPVLMQQVVPLLREAGESRDCARLLELGLSCPALARCAHLLGSAALTLGQPRLCRIYVMAARVVQSDGAALRGNEPELRR